MRQSLKQLHENNRGQNVTAGSIMLTFVVLLIGLALFGPVQDFTAAANASATSATIRTIVQLIPLFYILLVLAVAAIPVVVAFKKSG